MTTLKTAARETMLVTKSFKNDNERTKLEFLFYVTTGNHRNNLNL